MSGYFFKLNFDHHQKLPSQLSPMSLPGLLYILGIVCFSLKFTDTKIIILNVYPLKLSIQRSKMHRVQ